MWMKDGFVGGWMDRVDSGWMEFVRDATVGDI